MRVHECSEYVIFLDVVTLTPNLLHIVRNCVDGFKRTYFLSSLHVPLLEINTLHHKPSAVWWKSDDCKQIFVELLHRSFLNFHESWVHFNLFFMNSILTIRINLQRCFIISKLLSFVISYDAVVFMIINYSPAFIEARSWVEAQVSPNKTRRRMRKLFFKY